jgi:acyl carrier protein
MAQLLTASDGVEIQTLRYVYLVGDVLTRSDAAKLRKLAPCVTCVNLYGATETHFSLSHFVVPTASDDESLPLEKEVLPLGKGIKDVQLLLLNAGNGMCGIGEVGEICFRSPHLTLGYLRDDALTQERFVMNPFTNASGDQLYRTGDLGRYLPDGNVEFLGRLDRQVKIRGFRIELGEIEAALVDHPDINAVAVKLHEKNATERFLAAYVVSAQNAAVSSAELRRHLGQKLPDYMIPHVFVAMDGLPLLPNGKVDHAALPPPAISGTTLERTFVPPQTPAEEEIAAIWMELLGLEKVGVHNNFFELGGHSLLATQVMSRVRDRFQSELTMRQLFESPTVAGLALAVVQEQANRTEPDNLKDILAELGALSDEETKRLLNTEMP